MLYSLHRLWSAVNNDGWFTVQEYVSRHSDMVVIDPLQNIMKLFDRHQQYDLVKQCLAFDGIKGLFSLCA